MGKKRNAREKRKQARAAAESPCRDPDPSPVTTRGLLTTKQWLLGGAALIIFMLVGIYGLAAILVTLAGK